MNAVFKLESSLYFVTPSTQTSAADCMVRNEHCQGYQVTWLPTLVSVVPVILDIAGDTRLNYDREFGLL